MAQVPVAGKRGDPDIAWRPCPSCGGPWPSARLRWAREGLCFKTDVFEKRCVTFCRGDCEHTLYVPSSWVAREKSRILRSFLYGLYVRAERCGGLEGHADAQVEVDPHVAGQPAFLWSELSRVPPDGASVTRGGGLAGLIRCGIR